MTVVAEINCLHNELAWVLPKDDLVPIPPLLLAKLEKAVGLGGCVVPWMRIMVRNLKAYVTVRVAAMGEIECSVEHGSNHEHAKMDAGGMLA